jgi:hypothetical protein
MGKALDAGKYGQGDFFKALSYNFMSIYGYSNLDNYGWGGEIVKAILEFTVGIDQYGDVSYGDLLLNCLALTIPGVGGLAAKGAKGVIATILKKIPKKLRVAATKIVEKFVETIGKVTKKIPQGALNEFNLRENIVDMARIMTGDLTPIFKILDKTDLGLFSISFRKFSSGVVGVSELSKGNLKGALILLNSNLKDMAGFFKNKNFYSYLEGLVKTSEAKRDLSAIAKAVNEFQDMINKVLEENP